MDSMYNESSPAPSKSESSPESVDKEIEDESEIVAPKNLVGEDIKEGDVCKFRITADYGDEVGMKYIAEGGERQRHRRGMMDESDEELDRMDQAEET